MEKNELLWFMLHVFIYIFSYVSFKDCHNVKIVICCLSKYSKSPKFLLRAYINVKQVTL